MSLWKTRGIFFSLVSIFLMLLFVSNIVLITRFRIEESEMEVTRARVKILNSIFKELESSYFDTMLSVSSKSALIALSRYYHESNFNNIEYQLWKALSIVMPDGRYVTLEGEEIDFVERGYMEHNRSLRGMIEAFSSEYGKIGVEIEELSIDIVSARQVNPWTITVEADINYDFRDDRDIASWRGYKRAMANITIFGIYLYDTPWGAKENFGIVNSSWVVDNAPRSELSAFDKLSGGISGLRGMGVCSPYFNYNGMNCSNDIR